MAFFLLSSRFEGSLFGFGGMRSALLFLGTAHVPATIFFYIDKDFAEIVSKHKVQIHLLPNSADDQHWITLRVREHDSSSLHIADFLDLAGISLWTPEYRHLLIRLDRYPRSAARQV